MGNHVKVPRPKERMSSVDRPLAGKPLQFSLGAGGHTEWVDQVLLARSGRTARTLVKDGPLRVTLIALSAGDGLADHHADGPITVHVLSGALRFHISAEEWELAEGDLLSVGAGIPHSVTTDTSCVFLLTVALTDAPSEG